MRKHIRLSEKSNATIEQFIDGGITLTELAYELHFNDKVHIVTMIQGEGKLKLDLSLDTEEDCPRTGMPHVVRDSVTFYF